MTKQCRLIVEDKEDMSSGPQPQTQIGGEVGDPVKLKVFAFQRQQKVINMTLKNRTPFYPVHVNQKIRYFRWKLEFFDFTPKNTVFLPNLQMQIFDPLPQILGHKGPPDSFCPRAPHTH